MVFRSLRLSPVLAALAFTGALAAGALAFPDPAHGSPEGPLRVLFIGNSYTRFNDLPRMVERLAESIPEGRRVRARRETHGGFNLRRHWRIRRVRSRVRTGHWDTVVLQPHSLSAFQHEDELREYASRFREQAESSGARVVLFGTWARHPESRTYAELGLSGPAQMQARIDAVYASLGAELGAPVAPVGRAWLTALGEAPDLRLHRDDGTHPSLAGTYLSACVLLTTLTGQDPRLATWRHWRLPRGDAARIRELAAASLALPDRAATPAR